MCEPKENGGRRCDVGFGYTRKMTNLQAKKQYHEKRLNQASLNETQRDKSEKALRVTLEEMNTLRAEHKEFGAGQNYHLDVVPETEQVLNVLEKHGLTPYIVGGSVRDALLNNTSKDIDIEVYGGDVEKVIRVLKTVGDVNQVGKSFGVLKITIGEEDFDISLPRKDSKTGEGHTGFEVEVDPDLSLEEATARRDYTVNSLMYSHKHGYIIDKHGGLEDLENRELRHVSDAFDEDPLRVLRGVQMASRFGMTLHPETVEKAKTLKNSFGQLAKERVREEFSKLYRKGEETDKSLELLQQAEWDEIFLV